MAKDSRQRAKRRAYDAMRLLDQAFWGGWSYPYLITYFARKYVTGPEHLHLSQEDFFRLQEKIYQDDIDLMKKKQERSRYGGYGKKPYKTKYSRLNRRNAKKLCRDPEAWEDSLHPDVNNGIGWDIL